MPKPIPAAKRAAVLRDIKAGGPRNLIARAHGVSPGTVTGIAKAEGLTGAFDRSQTKSATEAAVADNKARRAATSRRFLDKCNDLMDRMDRPHLAFAFGGKDNTYNEHQLPEPPVDALRSLMTAAAVAFDKHLAADRHDAEDGGGASAVDAWLREMLSETR